MSRTHHVLCVTRLQKASNSINSPQPQNTNSSIKSTPTSDTFYNRRKTTLTTTHVCPYQRENIHLTRKAG